MAHRTTETPSETARELGSEASGEMAHNPNSLRVARREAHSPGLGDVFEVAGGFWTKLNNDWIFNLAGLLAYNFLMALFPLLLLLLAGCGIVLEILSPAAEQQLQQAIADALPGTTGTILVQAVSIHLKKSVGLLLAVGLVVGALAGSRFFVTLEGCFGIIFRLRGRDPIRQNRMAFGMLVLYLLVAPIVLLVSILPTSLVDLMDPHGQSLLLFGVLLSDGARLLVWFAAALLFFGVTYASMRHQRIRDALGAPTGREPSWPLCC
jgi:membrane protein